MKKGFFVALVALPIVISILLLLNLTSGLFEAWTRVDAPTEKLTNYFSAPKNADGYPEAIQECKLNKIELSVFANKPRDIVACVQITDYGVDGAEHLILAKDGNETLWKWEFVSSVTSDIFGYFIVFVGVLFSGVILLVRFLRKRKKGK